MGKRLELKTAQLVMEMVEHSLIVVGAVGQVVDGPMEHIAQDVVRLYMEAFRGFVVAVVDMVL